MPGSLDTLPDIPYGDVFNAACLVQLYGEDLRFCKPLGGWLHWTGTHWKLDQIDYIMELARQTITRLGEIALQRQNTEMLKHISRCFQHRQLTNMLRQAETFPDVVATTDQFDQDSWLLNCQNGTIDLRYGLIDQTRPHRREDWITRCLDIPYSPDAECPTWQAFLWRVMGGPLPEEEGSESALLERHERAERLVSFLQRAVGYALTGRTDEQCVFILYGTGRNGKSRFIEACHELLGPYAKSANMQSFLHQERETVRNDLADLHGVRLVSAIEANQGQKFSEGLLKQLTGGDRVKARFLFKEYFEFLPHFKLFLAFNHKPVLKGNDMAVWERVRMIPFDVYIPPHERDPYLQEKLRAELPGILTWAVDGCLAWQVGVNGSPSGLRPPEEVTQATEAYHREMDDLGEFLDERCLRSDLVRVDGKDLYQAYVDWCGHENQPPMHVRTFALDLQHRGVTRQKSNGKVWYKGIALKDISSD